MPDEAAHEDQPSEAAGAADAPSAAALMPYVLCMDLQSAQDEIQKGGVFLSRSVDASGRGRRQIWDRNWVVVEQTPGPGDPIGEGEAVLMVVKDDETSACTGDADEVAAPAEPAQAEPQDSATRQAERTTLAPVEPTTAPTPPPITEAPRIVVTLPPPPPTTVPVQQFIPTQDCDPNYEGACVPIASDVDCAGGSGNGPAYVSGPVYVVGNDIYDLDRDGNGVGCE